MIEWIYEWPEDITWDIKYTQNCLRFKIEIDFKNCSGYKTETTRVGITRVILTRFGLTSNA